MHTVRDSREIEPRYDAAVDRDLRHTHFHHFSPFVRYRLSLELVSIETQLQMLMLVFSIKIGHVIS